jgi:hypothetical protein
MGMICASRSGGIAGGFVAIPVASLMFTWRACRSGPLGIGEFRVWLAAHEMVARRCRLEEGRRAAYGVAELAGLLGITRKRAAASLRRLEVAGLLEWSDSAVAFPGPPDGVVDDLADTIGRGRGSVAVPRRIVRFLARGARPTLVATALGLLLRCLARRRAGFDGRGRLRAAWVAATFGVDLRGVKRARRELLGLGWIAAEPSDPWATRRWGAVFTIDLGWGADQETGARLPPIPAESRSAFTTPRSDQEPLRERAQHQEPGPAGPAGVQLGEIGGGNRTPPGPGPSAVPRSSTTVEAGPTSKPAPWPSPPSATPVEAGPRLRDVRVEDLKDIGRTLTLFAEAVGLGWVGSSEADRLRFVGAAEHARAIGRGKPPGLFIHLVRGKLWRYLTQEDEDRANGRIRAFLRGPEPPRMASASSRPPVRPVLSEDARAVREFRRALAAAGYRGDPFPQVRRHDPSWTRERWDLALAELEGA